MGKSGDYRIRYRVELDKLKRQLQQAEEMIKAFGGRVGALTQSRIAVPTLSPQATATLNANAKATNAITAANRERRLSEEAVAKAAERQRRATERASQTAREGSKDFRLMGLALKRMLLWWSSAALLLGAKRLASNVAEIAGAFQFLVRELTVLGDEGEEIYAKLALAGSDAAIATGRSFTESADAMKAWIRQGFSAVEIADLTRTTLIGLNLTQIGSVELVRTLTAQMKAYNIPAADSITIIDKLVGVSRKYAIETGQLAVGMRRFAAVSSEAGLSLEQQAGLMTAMMVRTQQAAQMVGRAGRTILTRMRRNAVETIEEIGQINVFTDESRSSYRDMFEILRQLAAKWDEFTDAERAAIAFQAGGLRQQEFFIALMKDFKIAQEASIVALESAGLAYRSNEILVNSFNKALAGLRATWDQILARQTGILEFFTSIVHGLTSLAQVAATIPEHIVAISTALVGVAGIITLVATGGGSIVGWVLTLASAFTLLARAIGQGSTVSMDRMISKAQDLTQARLSEAQSIEKLAAEYRKLFEQYKDGADNADLLVRTREALDKLNPALLSGERDLEKIYDTLTEQTSALTAETQRLYDERLKLHKLTTIEQRTVATEDIRSAKIGLPTEFADLKFADPQKVKQLAHTLKNELTDSYLELLEVRRIYADTDKELNKEEIALVEKYTEALHEARAEVSRGIGERRAIASFVDAPFETISGKEREAKAQEKVTEQIAADILVRQEEIQTVLDLADAYDRLEVAEAALFKLTFDTGDEFGPFGKPAIGKTIVSDESRKALNEEVKLMQQRLRLTFVQSFTEARREKQAGDAARFAESSFQRTISFLRQIAAVDSGRDPQTRQAAADQLQTLEEGTAEFLKLQLTVANAQYDVMINTIRVREQADKRRAREADELFNKSLKLERLNSRMTDQQIQNALAVGSAEVDQVFGSLAAAQFRFAELERLHQQEKANLAELRKDPSEDPEVRAKVANQENVVRKREQDRNAAASALEIANIRERSRLGDANVAQEQAIQEIRIRALATSSTDIDAAKARVDLLEEQFVKVQAIVDAGGSEVELVKARTQLEEAQGVLAAAREEHVQALIKAEKELGEAGFDATVARIRLVEGEAVALDVVVAKRQEELVALKLKNTDGKLDLEIKEAEGALLAANIAVELNGLKEVNALRKERRQLDEEIAQENFDHAVAMVSIEEGRLAGSDKALELIQAEISELEKVQDTGEALLEIDKLRAIQKGIINDQVEEEARRGQQLIQDVGGLVFDELSKIIAGGTLSLGDAAEGITGIISNYVGTGNPFAGMVISGIGTVLGAIFKDPADNLSDSMDRSAEATLKLEQTLSDIQQQQIGVPTSFVLPPAITMGGSLRGSAGNTTIVQTNTILLDAGDRDGAQLGAEIYDYLEDRASVDSRRGFAPQGL